jgi:DegV family protein with EDD domain
VNSARLAADGAAAAVRVVDTGTASFGVACCVWEAAEALAAGASLEEAASVAEQVGARVGTVFTVGALDLARAGGRLSPGTEGGGGVPVLTMADGEMQVVRRVADLDEAVDAMVAVVVAAGPELRAAVGTADDGAAPLARALAERLTGTDGIREVVRYRIGPSVGAHTGPGTAGAYFYRTGA